MTALMMVKRARILAVCIAAAFLSVCPGFTETLVLEGVLDGAMRVTQISRFAVDQEVGELLYRFALPAQQSTRTVSQTISGLTIDYEPQPVSVQEEVDGHGNIFKVATWKGLKHDVTVTVSYTARVKSNLPVIKSTAPYPPPPVTEDASDFLKPTKEIQSDHPHILSAARELTAGTATQYGAVTAIINHVADTITYAHNPAHYDALHTLETKKGNCTNIAHAAIALLRAAGIPARMVGGIGLKKRWAVPIGAGGNLIQGFARGSHAWIEVYYPDLGWLPCDTQQTKNFTSTRHIKKTHGADLHSLADSWRATPYLPKYSSQIEEHFIEDIVSVRLRSSEKMPKLCMLSNDFRAQPAALVAEKPPAPVKPLPSPHKPVPDIRDKPPEPVVTPPEPVREPQPSLENRTVFGNLEFPTLVDLYRTIGNRGITIFDMETAEYATSGHVYAQSFQTRERLFLDSVSLAMRRFGGDGMVFIDIVNDDDGRPGTIGFRSRLVCLENLRKRPGYYWVVFGFPKDTPAVLESGKHWIILRHSGEAVMNWFYTPGKPYGGIYDTRSTTKGFEWDDILGYDFVFKVEGRR